MNGLTELVEHAGGAGAVTARAVSFAGIAGVVGAVSFRSFVVRRVLRAPEQAAGVEQLAARTGLLCALALIAMAPIRVVMQAKGLTFEGDPWTPMVARVISTAWGHAMVWQLAAAFVAAVGFARTSKGSGWWHAGVGGLVLSVTPALTGHAAAVESTPRLAMAADIAHVLGAGVWVGGLAVLSVAAFALRTDARGGETMATMIGGFHRVAKGSVAALAASGAVAIWLHFRSPADFTGSSYGRILIVKLVLVAIGVVLGWRHSVTAAAKARAGGSRSITTSLAAEWAVLILVLLVSGLLAGSPPPGTE